MNKVFITFILSSLLLGKLYAQNKLGPTGNAGIGTNSPSSEVKLEIKAPNRQLRITDSDDNKFWQLSGSSNALGFRYQEGQSDEKLALWLNSLGRVGIGTVNPSSQLEVESYSTPLNSTDAIKANMVIQGTSNSRSTEEGSALGFVVPASTDGSGHWQQGRIMVTPDNTSNNNASGRMYLQTRYLNTDNLWHWRNNITLRSSGNVGIGTVSPSAQLEVESYSTPLNSTDAIKANMVIKGRSNSRSTEEGSALGFVVPASTDGSNHWQQGRIMVTPDNTSDGNASGRMYLQTRYLDTDHLWHWRNNIVLRSNGSVGIGTQSTFEYKLAVNGKIGAKEIKCEISSPWPDYVFKKEYDLPSLKEVEAGIKKNGHLKHIPTAAEVKEDGVELARMSALLLQKIEELTLYTIEQQKRIESLEDQLRKPKK